MTDPTREPPALPEWREKELANELHELPGTPADPEFRERLRRNFVSGAVGAPRHGQGGHRRPTTGWLRGLGLAAAAVALLAIGLSLLRPRTEAEAPRWSTHASGAQASRIRIGDRVLTLPADTREFAAALDAGIAFTIEDTLTLDLVLGRLMSVQVTPGTSVRLPARSPGTQSLAGDLLAGEIRVSTGPDFAGRTLSFHATGAEVLVRGTTFAVIRGADSTCVCVYEGRVDIHPDSGAAAPLDAGLRWIHADGAPEARTEPITPMEAMKLQMFRDAAIERTRPAGPR
jgi:hypothetical protein